MISPPPPFRFSLGINCKRSDNRFSYITDRSHIFAYLYGGALDPYMCPAAVLERGGGTLESAGSIERHCGTAGRAGRRRTGSQQAPSRRAR